MTLEYLATEAPPRRRQSWALGVVVVVLVALAAGLLWWTDTVRRNANDQLAEAFVAAQEQARIGEATVLSTLVYAQPMIWSSSVPEDVRSGLRDLVEGDAAAAAAALSAIADGISGTLVLPWQGTQRQAQEALLALVGQYESRVARIAEDARVIGTVMAEPAPSDAEAQAALGASGAEASLDR